MYKYYNPNPDGNNVGDCTVRAICKATGVDDMDGELKNKVYMAIFLIGFTMLLIFSGMLIWFYTVAVIVLYYMNISTTRMMKKMVFLDLQNRWRIWQDDIIMRNEHMK